MDEYRKPYLTLFNGVTDALARWSGANMPGRRSFCVRPRPPREAAYIEAGE